MKASVCREVQAHIQEPFWSISVAYRAAGETCDFGWDRHRLFDRAAAVVLHEMCLEANLATVTKVRAPARLVLVVTLARVVVLLCDALHC